MPEKQPNVAKNTPSGSYDMAAFEKMETQFGLIVGVSAFACIGLIFLESPYFVAFVILAAVFGVGRYVVRRKMKELANDTNEGDSGGNPGRKNKMKFKYPEKPGRTTPFTDLLQKLGH